MSKSIKFYFDILSPYSYFGFEGITKNRSFWKTSVELKPFLLGAIVKQSNNAEHMPLMNADKTKYMMKDLKFMSQYWGIPFRIPKNYKEVMMTKSSAVPQRVLIACKLRDGEEEMENLTRKMAHLFWAYGKPIFTDKQIQEALRYSQIANSEELFQLSKTQEVRAILKQNTQEALDYGCFGAPWTHIIDNSTGNVVQTVFGSDRLPQIANFVGEKFRNDNV